MKLVTIHRKRQFSVWYIWLQFYYEQNTGVDDFIKIVTKIIFNIDQNKKINKICHFNLSDFVKESVLF